MIDDDDDDDDAIVRVYNVNDTRHLPRTVLV